MKYAVCIRVTYSHSRNSLEQMAPVTLRVLGIYSQREGHGHMLMQISSLQTPQRQSAFQSSFTTRLKGLKRARGLADKDRVDAGRPRLY